MRSTKMMVTLLSLATFAAIGGCTHAMNVKNLDEYPADFTDGEAEIDIAIRTEGISEDSEGRSDQNKYVQAVVRALREHPGVRLVRYGWKESSSRTDFRPSHVVYLDVQPDYEGSGINFLITWPGCYIFVCAWAGYQYEANVPTTIRACPVAREKDTLITCGASVDEMEESLPVTFEMSHCDFERGFWSGTGWWFPGFGLHNIVTGIIFIKYDPDATGPFHERADDTYGRHVAGTIVQMLRDAGSEKHAMAIRKPAS